LAFAAATDPFLGCPTTLSAAEWIFFNLGHEVTL
jgi:hypothetical protein